MGNRNGGQGRDIEENEVLARLFDKRPCGCRRIHQRLQLPSGAGRIACGIHRDLIHGQILRLPVLKEDFTSDFILGFDDDLSGRGVIDGHPVHCDGHDRESRAAVGCQLSDTNALATSIVERASVAIVAWLVDRLESACTPETQIFRATVAVAAIGIAKTFDARQGILAAKQIPAG